MTQISSIADGLPQPSSRGAYNGGIAAGIGAGALWGLVFLAPEFAGEFGPLQLSIGRYLCYGLIAAALILPRWHVVTRQLDKRTWFDLIWLALAGNALYYVLLSSAVQNGGIALTSLVNGFLPVAVTIVGARERGAVPLRILVPSLLLCVAGGACIAWQAVGIESGSPDRNRWLGLICAFGTLACWAAYAVGNTRALTRVPRVSAQDWNLLMGVVAGIQCLALIPLAIAVEDVRHDSEAWLRFGLVSLGVALLASIAGNALWNRMSRVLPLTLIGQMILFQSLFALVYGLMWEQRFPTLLESVGLALVATSVFACVAAHRRLPAAMQGAIATRAA